ncbi:hypothetical protein IW138_001299 [Coemansia sp. RSA 986]|nr:hypothetical protein LPJ74_000942 [Coemansia sp. RSA 1843]KAJ2092232.1 hypothetical protein IW138_001299 [Coemansia sp. RSA 986]
MWRRKCERLLEQRVKGMYYITRHGYYLARAETEATKATSEPVVAPKMGKCKKQQAEKPPAKKPKMEKMCIAFEVAVRNHLGNRLRGAINIFRQSAIRLKALCIALKVEGASEDDIDWAIQERIKDPMKLVKEQVASSELVLDGLDADTYNCAKAL